MPPSGVRSRVTRAASAMGDAIASARITKLVTRKALETFNDSRNITILSKPWHSQISRQKQARLRLQQSWRAVDERRHRRMIAGNTSIYQDIHRRLAFNLNCIMRLRRVQIHLQIERQANFPVHFRLCPLMKPAGLALFRLQILCLNIPLRNYRISGFDDPSGFPPKAMGDQRKRFFQTGMSSFARFEQSPKFFRRQPAANLSLQWRATRRGVHHTLNMNSSHFTAYTRHAQGQEIHHKSRIHTGPNHSRTTLFANPIEFPSELWLA